MTITILTLFPEMFQGPFDYSIIKNAKEKDLVKINFVNIRDFGEGKHKMVDDTEYGGGVGMVMKVDVLHKAINYAKSLVLTSSNKSMKDSITGRTNNHTKNQRIILLSATGKTYSQQKAQELSHLEHLILICGHYEGIDDRIKDFIDEEISVGDFVLTGGELPAMLITDSITRLLKGVLPNGAVTDESFSDFGGQILLEYPHFTKPRDYKGKKVPEILLSGNHPKIQEWRRSNSVKITKELRPDLIKKGSS
jgi:tRNA (guanine37-N1)-methyltransferase